MQWILPYNSKDYDLKRSLIENDNKVNWGSNFKGAVGDIVYLRGTIEGRITYMFEIVDIVRENNDEKYYLSNRFKENNSKNKAFRKLKLLKEIDDDRLDNQYLIAHDMPKILQGPVRVQSKLFVYINQIIDEEDFNNKLNFLKNEIFDESNYDGSYELMSVVLSEYYKNDFSKITYADANFIYLTSVGNWRYSFEKRKKVLRNGSLALSGDSISTIEDTLDRVWEKARNGEYVNKENNKVSVGIFGTGMYKLRENDEILEFFKKVISLVHEKDDDAFYETMESTLSVKIKGLSFGVISQVLHTMRPRMFPAINGSLALINVGFNYLGVTPLEANQENKYVKFSKELRSKLDNNMISIDRLSSNISKESNKKIKLIQDGDGFRVLEKDYFNVEKWKEIIQIEALTNIDVRMTLVKWAKEEDRSSSCKAMGLKYQKPYKHFNGIISNYGSLLCTFYNITIDDDGIETFHSLIMDGKKSDDKSTYIYRLRNNIYEALKELGLLDESKELKQIETGSIDDFDPYDWEILKEESFAEPKIIDDIQYILKNKKNLIIEGAPGTGKTFMSNRIAYAMQGNKSKNNIRYVQFHQSYSYEDFVQGYRPAKNGSSFELVNGVFYNLVIEAIEKPEEKFFIIIDEINRGNVSKIFGELLALIENDKRIGSDNVLEANLQYDSKKIFSIPGNLYIIGLMNTADKSLTGMDYALRRRFSFVRIEPNFDNTILENIIVNQSLCDHIKSKFKWLNEKISKELDSGYVVGHSYFCGAKSDEGLTVQEYNNIIMYEIKPLISEYYYDISKKRLDDIIDRLLCKGSVNSNEEDSD